MTALRKLKAEVADVLDIQVRTSRWGPVPRWYELTVDDADADHNIRTERATTFAEVRDIARKARNEANR